VALAGVVAIAVIATGCGGGGDTSSSSGSADSGGGSDNPTKAEFISQGDAICKKGNSDIQTEAKSYAKENGINLKKKPTKEQLDEISENVVVPSLRNQLEALKELGIPSEGEEVVEELLESLEEGIEKGEEDPSAFVGEGTVLVKADKLAKEYGFKECGGA
jgi:hypothetical protein